MLIFAKGKGSIIYQREKEVSFNKCAMHTLHFYFVGQNAGYRFTVYIGHVP